ncbi:MAG: hypothetical protein GYB36_10710 [Alphaproteobacteria bacterium]|nr:hypothetical protein [Alphaproteobacteria bacterium]
MTCPSARAARVFSGSPSEKIVAQSKVALGAEAPFAVAGLEVVLLVFAAAMI